MQARSKAGWIGLGGVVCCVVAFLSEAAAVILVAVLGGWAVAVLRKPDRRAIVSTLLGVPATNRGPHVTSAFGELGLAVVIVICGIKGSTFRSEHEEKEKQRATEVQHEADRKAAEAKDGDLRAHSQESIDAATKAVADSKRGMEQGDYSVAQRSLGEAKAIVTRYKDLIPPLLPMSDLKAQVDDVEQDLNVVGSVTSALSDAPTKLAEAASKVKEKDYIAADRIYADLLNGLDVPQRSARYVSMADVKKVSGTVQNKRHAIGAAVTRQQVQVGAAELYEKLCGEKPVQSAWDGSIIGLERNIKETANDPDSIDVAKCTLPELSEKHCWVSTCNVRGKNAFGALILLRKTYSFSTLGIEELR